MKTAIVTTTIHVPKALESYVQNLKQHGHSDSEVEFVVIGDKKSPAETGEYLESLEQSSGYTISWWDVERQREWLKDQPELDKLLPYNSVQRRNLGYLQAVVRGAECIIAIDDDNWTTDDDYLGGHGIVGESMSLDVVSSSTGWFNSASLLQTEPVKPLFHRGYPTCMRGIPEKLTHSTLDARVVVNAGFWMDVPDADAMSHVDVPCNVVGYRKDFEGRLGVAYGTNMVFNSQNTAFHRDTLPAMFLPPMGGHVGTLEVGRYDDIWMSIFVKVIADHLGDLVCVGKPWVRQLRNDHDLLQDMLVEIPAQRITNKFTRSMPKVRLTANDYGACYRELISELRRLLPEDGYTDDERKYLEGVLDGMEVWAGISDGYLASVEA